MKMYQAQVIGFWSTFFTRVNLILRYVQVMNFLGERVVNFTPGELMYSRGLFYPVIKESSNILFPDASEVSGTSI